MLDYISERFWKTDAPINHSFFLVCACSGSERRDALVLAEAVAAAVEAAEVGGRQGGVRLPGVDGAPAALQVAPQDPEAVQEAAGEVLHRGGHRQGAE